MDEPRLTQLFRDAADSAARDAPPPSFSHADVLAGSEQARRRHRHRVTGGVAAATVVLAAAGLATGLSLGPDPASSYTASPSARSAQPENAAPFAAKEGANSCAAPDTKLFDQFRAALPGIGDARPRPLPSGTHCPSGTRGFEADVTDGSTRGTLRVVLLPRGASQFDVQINRGGGSISTTNQTTSDGRRLSVTTTSAHGRAPFEDELDDVVDKIANQN